MSKRLPKTALEYVLWSLVPYTDPNLKLVFVPRRFFEDLSTISRNNRLTLRNAYYRGVKQGYIDNSNKLAPKLTKNGRQKVHKYTATELGKNSRLMVIFDIPETLRAKRQHFRRLLQDLEFVQIQKSVWVSELDHRQAVKQEVVQENLSEFVKIYEALQLKH